jgi:hypothetical protein
MTGPPPAHPEDWPDPRDRVCDDCGHVWFAGERRHEYADPGADSPDESDVVCILCRQKRQARARVDR